MIQGSWQAPDRGHRPNGTGQALHITGESLEVVDLACVPVIKIRQSVTSCKCDVRPELGRIFTVIPSNFSTVFSPGLSFNALEINCEFIFSHVPSIFITSTALCYYAPIFGQVRQKLKHMEWSWWASRREKQG
jgi:hypothetical protein